MNKRLLAVNLSAVLLLSIYSQHASAETIKYEIIGTVSDVATPLQGDQISVGDSIIGHFFADTVATSVSAGGSAWYATSDLVIDIGASYQLTATTGAIQVDRATTPDNISFHFTNSAGLTGPIINDNWTPDYFHQHIWNDVETLELPLDMGVDGLGVRVNSQLRFNIDDATQLSFSLTKIAVVEENPTPSLPNLYYGIAGLGDINGNSFPEIAFLRTVPSGNVHVLYRDAISRDYIKTVTFFNASYEPLDITALPDGNNNGYQEIAVMALNTETGMTRTVIKDSYTDERLAAFNFYP